MYEGYLCRLLFAPMAIVKRLDSYKLGRFQTCQFWIWGSAWAKQGIELQLSIGLLIKAEGWCPSSYIWCTTMHGTYYGAVLDSMQTFQLSTLTYNTSLLCWLLLLGKKQRVFFIVNLSAKSQCLVLMGRCRALPRCGSTDWTSPHPDSHSSPEKNLVPILTTYRVTHRVTVLAHWCCDS